jgi:NAD(P)H-dependent FMN reductase
MNIEIISGSPRTNSVTKRVALHLFKNLSENSKHSINVIDMQEWPIPPIQSVWVSVDKAPAAFQPLAKRIFEADAFVLVTPEYNGSYSPAMKNLFDHFPKQLRRPFGLVTASPGALGGMRAAQQLLLLVPALFGYASPNLLIVPAVDKKFDADGNLLDEKFQNSLHGFVAEFLYLAEKLSNNQ